MKPVHSKETSYSQDSESHRSPPTDVAFQSEKFYLRQEALMVCFSIAARQLNPVRWAFERRHMRALSFPVISAVCLASFSALGQVQSLPSTFTNQEIRNGARAAHNIFERKPYSAEEASQAEEFSGYVGGFIDAKTDGPTPDPTLVECLRTNKRPRIVQRAASLLVDPNIKPTGSVRFDVGFAVSMACRDEYWGAKAPQPTNPSPWAKFGENSRLISYFQRAQEGAPTLPVAWVLYEYKTEQQSDRSNRRYWSEKAKQEIDCDHGRTRTTFFTRHQGKLGNGQVVYTGRSELPWEPNAPGSIAAALATAMCAS